MMRSLVLWMMCLALGSRGGVGQETKRPVAKKPLPPLLLKLINGIPFSFTYGGKPSRQLLAHWIKTEARRTLTGGAERRLTVYRDPKTGLELTREMTIYRGFSAVDWIVRLRNTGRFDTPVIERLLPLNFDLPLPRNGALTLRSAHGSSAKPDDFLPVRKTLKSGADFHSDHYVMQSGKQVGTGFPYFDITWQGGGIIGAIGWTGQWLLHAQRNSDRDLELQAGQESTRFRLHPGESILTPRILLLEWAGPDRWSGHNQFRRLLISHFVPRIDGKVAVDPVSHTGAYVLLFDGIARKTGKNPLEVLPTLKPSELTHANRLPTPDDALNWVNETNQLQLIRGLVGSGIEAYWLDAGWFAGGWPFGAGNWTPDRKKFPQGLKPLGDAAHAQGLKFILWFEPKRVAPGSIIAREHPEWVLHFPGEGKLGGVYNLGIPAARRWMTQLLSQRIKEWGVDIYRNDSNICPLPFWRAADTPDRQGMTEIRDVEGLYELWDSLLKHQPGLMIDNANWRITGPDIEVMKRSIGSLTRSEVDGAGIPYPVLDQAETEELNLWVPLAATIVNGVDPYTFRSAATTGACISLDLRSKFVPIAEVRQAIAEEKSLRPFWLGDYYPLSSIDISEDDWSGWQFNRRDLGAGFAVFFRRSPKARPLLEPRLHGLLPAAKYQVTFAETYQVAERRIMTGAQLADLPIQINSAQRSMLVRYQRLGHGTADYPAGK